jgi:hypothetical protein
MFFEVFHYRDYTETDGRMTDELEKIRKETVVTYMRYYPGIGLRKPLKPQSGKPMIGLRSERNTSGIQI